MGTAAAAAAALTVALFTLVATQPASAIPVEPPLSTLESGYKQQPYTESTSTSPQAEVNFKAVVVFGSGRQVALATHRRLLDVAVRLPSGEERTFPSGEDFLAEARGEGLEGAEFIVPAEAFPCDLVLDVFATELARRAHVLTPSGDKVPYDQFMRQQQQQQAGEVVDNYVADPEANAYHRQPLYHKQPELQGENADSLDDVPEDQLLVALGGSQRLSLKVHDAVLRSYESKQPVQVALASSSRHRLAKFKKSSLVSKFVEISVLLSK